MATGSTTTTHPLLACVEEVAAAVSKVVGPAAPDPDYLSVDDKADYLVSLDREVTRLTALLARGLAGAADVAERDGARDPGSWLAAQRATTPVTTRPAFKLGVRLRRRPATAAAIAQRRARNERGAWARSGRASSAVRNELRSAVETPVTHPTTSPQGATPGPAPVSPGFETRRSPPPPSGPSRTLLNLRA